MKEELIKKLLGLKGKMVDIIIAEGRIRKREEKGIIKELYNNIFTIEINDVLTSFSYSDLICGNIILRLIK